VQVLQVLQVFYAGFLKTCKTCKTRIFQDFRNLAENFGFGDSSSRSSSGVLFVLFVFCHHFPIGFLPLGILIWVWLLVTRSPWRRRDDVVGDVYALWGCWSVVVLSALERLGSAPGLHRLCVPSMGMLWPAVFGV
jgi:hypothetical protein